MSFVRCFAFLIVIVFVPGRGVSAYANEFTGDDVRIAKAAFRAADSEKWSRFRRLVPQIENQMIGKILRWLSYTSPNSGYSFEQISGFMDKNPNWPLQKTLQRRAEEAMNRNTDNNVVLRWFKKHHPITANGMERYGAALLAVGDRKHGRAVIREAWLKGNFGRRQERTFYKRYRRMLTSKDHVRRLDRLLWEGRYWPSMRMLWKVNTAWRALGEARIMLRHMRGNVDKAIARVPDKLKNNPGLVYERVRWRRRKGKYSSARELLANVPDNPVWPEKWWKERSFLARNALREGYISEAYDIAKKHDGLSKGAGFAESEWLAGWIAMRFLRDNDVAKKHFMTMLNAVKYPVSRARGAYWVARSIEAMGKKDAETWYRTAAGFTSTYYGQLAAARLWPGRSIKLPSDPKPMEDEIKAFNKNDLVRAVRVMGRLKESDRIAPFVTALSRHRTTPGWRKLCASLASLSGRPDLAIWVAKKSGRDGRVLIEAGYPAVSPPLLPAPYRNPVIEAPLMLAMIRQESAFYTRAISHAGARGLLQVIPRTARRVARRMKIPYSRKRLISDANYNLIIGQAYIFELIDKFKGSYILALASYNAGPARAIRWVRDNGNPREDSVDAIDWIEMIPFSETRNYIQRVLENLQIYRLRLADTEVALNLENDLKR